MGNEEPASPIREAAVLEHLHVGDQGVVEVATDAHQHGVREPVASSVQRVLVTGVKDYRTVRRRLANEPHRKPCASQAEVGLEDPIPLAALELTPVGVWVEPFEGGEIVLFREKKGGRREHGRPHYARSSPSIRPDALRLLCFRGGCGTQVRFVAAGHLSG